jgi:HEAT repeat protein
MGRDLPNLPGEYISGKHWNCFLEFVELELRQSVYEELKKNGLIHVYGIRNNLVLIGGAKLAPLVDAYNAVLQSKSIKKKICVYGLDRQMTMKLVKARPELEVGFVTYDFFNRFFKDEIHIEKRILKNLDFDKALKKSSRAVVVSDDSLSDIILELKQKDIFDKMGSIKIALEDEDIDAKVNKRLGEYGLSEITDEERFIKPISNALKDELWQVRQKAVAMLVWMADTKRVNVKIIELLLDVLKDENEHAYVRDEALRGLGKIGGIQVVNALSNIIRNSKDWKIAGRSAYIPAVQIAVKMLAKIGGLDVIEPIVLALKDDDSSVRGEAAKALGDIGNTMALEPLKHALKDKFSSVREESSKALEKIGAIAALQNADESAINPLIMALCSENKEIYTEAIETLQKIGEPAINPLIIALGHDNKEVHSRAIAALKKIGKPAIQPLIEALIGAGRNANKDVSINVCAALKLIGPPAVQPLIELLKDKDKGVRHGAGVALVSIGEPSIIPLSTLLKDKDEYICQLAEGYIEIIKESIDR